MRAARIGIVHTQTPLRISFLGGGTDFPGYFNIDGGCVLGTSVAFYSYVVVNSLPAVGSDRIKVSYSRLEQVVEPSQLKHEITRFVLERHPASWRDHFVDIHSYADLPAGAGLGSSSAYTVGFLHAIHSLMGSYRSPAELAREAISVERTGLGHAGGWQDQVLTAVGGLNRVEFNADSFQVVPVVLPPDRLAALESACVLYYGQRSGASASIQEKIMTQDSIAARRSLLDRLRDLASLGERTLRSACDNRTMVAEFGALLDEGWNLKRRMASSISTEQIDVLYESAMKAGAFGGKLCGAGGGGAMLFLVPEERRREVDRALVGMTPMDLRFERLGSRVIFGDYRS